MGCARTCVPLMTTHIRVWPAMAETTPRARSLRSSTGPCMQGRACQHKWSEPMQMHASMQMHTGMYHKLDAARMHEWLFQLNIHRADAQSLPWPPWNMPHY